jgi:hypothetical protein
MTARRRWLQSATAAGAALAAVGLAGCNGPGAAAAPLSDSQPASATPEPSAQPTPTDVGRYAIIHSPHVENDTILLDTETGQTWRQVSVTDVKEDPYVWIPEPQMNTPSDFAALVAEHGTKGNQAHAQETEKPASSAPEQ